ncbi:MAG: glycosyltransferase family 39 protein [Chloroflexota bacterium]|nr:glycosyltransferase family 39 protein [Chloroflexota bacterium]
MAETARRRIGRLAAPLLLLLLASYTQFHQLTRDLRFLPDEAFFMTFARGAAVNGDWLLPGPLDKPPLSIYISAMSMVAVGLRADAGGVLQLDSHLGEFAGKLPNALLAIMLTALMMRLAWRLYRWRWAAIFAGLLTATSPYMLALGASAFTDMSLLICSAAALYFTLTDRWTLAGLALGLAFWSKQQAALFAVLIVLILLARQAGRRDWLRICLALGLVCAGLLIWDGARPEASIFLQAAVNNSPGAWLAAPALWVGRMGAWIERGLWLLGPPLVTLGLLLGCAFVSLRQIWAGTTGGRPPRVERAMLVTIVAFFSLYALLRFNLYERYLLLMMPPLCLLVAGQLARLPIAGRLGEALLAVVAASLIASGLWSLNAGQTIGGDRGEQAGIDALAAHLEAKPVATVIYDPWLGWELSYYLGQWHDKRRAHYPTAEALAAGALALDEIGNRYFVAPLDQPHEAWLTALRDAGFGVFVDYERDRFIVYRLTAPQN